MTKMMAMESTEQHGKNMNKQNYLAAIFRLDNGTGAAPAVPVFVINLL